MIEIILGIAITAVVGLIVFVLIKRSRPVVEVMLCRERNRTGERIPIKNDFAKTMETDQNRKPAPLFFWKYSGGYAFNEGGRLVRRSFAREGSAYTRKLESKKELSLGLSTAIQAKAGMDFYNTIPEKYRKMLEDPTIHVLVDLEEGLTPRGYEPLSSEEVTIEGDRKSMRIYNDEMTAETKSTKARLLDVLLGFAVASAIVLFCVSMGWIGVPTIIVP